MIFESPGLYMYIIIAIHTVLYNFTFEARVSSFTMHLLNRSPVINFDTNNWDGSFPVSSKHIARVLCVYEENLKVFKSVWRPL